MANWPDLPSDLLAKITSPLSVPDLVRFSSVCRPWRSFAADLRHRRRVINHPPPPPWLMYSGDETAPGPITEAAFQNFSDAKIYRIDLPDPPIRSAMLIGSAHGWLILADEQSDLSLLNPITRQQILLPPVSAFDHIKPIRDSQGTIVEYIVDPPNHHEQLLVSAYRTDAEELRFRLYRKAILSSSPSNGDGDYTVILLLQEPYRYLAFAKSGDKKWTLIETHAGYDDMVYHKNQLYAVMSSGNVEVWDLSRPFPQPTVIVKGRIRDLGLDEDDEKADCFVYLVPTPCGDLLQVWRERVNAAGDNFTRQVTVHRVDVEKGKLVEVDSLKEYALFLGCNLSMCISTLGLDNVHRNSVYLTDDNWELSYIHRDTRRDIGLYKLEKGRMGLWVWGTEFEWWNWPPAIWFFPSFI